ncbi:unannotated protein [freshwater metagenome]|uniref:Unannotated protein n=1 Tax=freshwater metagenome TaxID=449393 RepID=A0A6J7IXL8_9ZZZZ
MPCHNSCESRSVICPARRPSRIYAFTSASHLGGRPNKSKLSFVLPELSSMSKRLCFTKTYSDSTPRAASPSLTPFARKSPPQCAGPHPPRSDGSTARESSADRCPLPAMPWPQVTSPRAMPAPSSRQCSGSMACGRQTQQNAPYSKRSAWRSSRECSPLQAALRWLARVRQRHVQFTPSIRKDPLEGARLRCRSVMSTSSMSSMAYRCSWLECRQSTPTHVSPQ